MSDRTLEEFVRQFIESQDVPVVNFTWQGGEPALMGLDFYRKAVDFQNKYSGGKRIENSFQTNGTLLNDEWCRFFHDNGFLIGISIDGEEHNHDHFRRTSSGGPTFKSVMKAIDLFHKYRIDFNTLSTVNSYNVSFAVETYRFLKRTGSGFIQFLPVVERESLERNESELKLVSHLFKGRASVTPWSVTAHDYGKFLISVFNEWVRNDVGRVFVQLFDASLANWYGEMPGICVFSDTCGDALALEHNGDIYSCDHLVYPDYYLGNIHETPLVDLARSQRQFDFGIMKRSTLPRYCMGCEFRFACHGECPKHRIIDTPTGEPGLNYLCEAYKMFFHHVTPYMEYMVKELNNRRAPANVMNWISNKERQVTKPLMPDRNDPCPCGSGKKFKNCCSQKPPYSNFMK